MASILNSISSLVSNNITGTNEMAESNSAQLRSVEEAGELRASQTQSGTPPSNGRCPANSSAAQRHGIHGHGRKTHT